MLRVSDTSRYPFNADLIRILGGVSISSCNRRADE